MKENIKDLDLITSGKGFMGKDLKHIYIREMLR